MMRLAVLWLPCVFFFAFRARAQGDQGGSSAANPLGAYPECAQKCIADTFSSGAICDLGDLDCSCNSEEFNQAVHVCVMGGCTLREALVTRNETDKLCDVPTNNRSAIITREVYVFLGFIFVLISARIVFKLCARGQDLWWDDYTIILLFILGGLPAMLITVVVLAPLGMGRDMWTLPFQSITDILMWGYVQSVLYYLQVAILKLTFLFFFLRIFPAKKARQVIIGTIWFCVFYGVAFCLAGIFACSPISYFWVWDGSSGGFCVDRNAIQWASAVISIALDVWMLAIPLWNIRHLKLPRLKKLSVASMFLVGAVATIVCCVRLKFLNDFFNSNNPTQFMFEVVRWSTIEGFTSVLCSCMPVMRQMLIQVFSKSKDRVKTAYGSRYGSKPTIRSTRGYAKETKNSDSSQVGHIKSKHDGVQTRNSRFAPAWSHQRNDSDELPMTGIESHNGGILQETSFAVDVQNAGSDSNNRDVEMGRWNYNSGSSKASRAF